MRTLDEVIIKEKNMSDKVSIVIAARNYDKYLPEAIESALAQDHPSEVIYVDDCSFDKSVSIARNYPIRIITNTIHRGVAYNRNKGFEFANGDWLINLDGDDVLPPNYVSLMLEAARPNTPMCYGAAQAFGDLNVLWEAPEWGKLNLWNRNFINTSAMYNRTAFFAAGGWQEGVGTMWDWDLALRASRFGTPRRSRAVLKYRIHNQSFSHNYQEREDATVKMLAPQVRRRLARLSIGSIISGRLPGFFEQWIDVIARSIRILNKKPDLVLLDNSGNPEFYRKILTRYEDAFNTIQVIPFGEKILYENQPERQDKISTLLANACNLLKKEMKGDIHWLVEDDILVKMDTAEKLFTYLTKGLWPVEAVTGVYVNRHAPTRIVGGWFRNGLPIEPKGPCNRSTRVDICGTGCLMYWKDKVPDWQNKLNEYFAHDWYWAMKIKEMGGKVIMLPDVQVGHAVDEGNILWP